MAETGKQCARALGFLAGIRLDWPWMHWLKG